MTAAPSVFIVGWDGLLQAGWLQPSDKAGATFFITGQTTKSFPKASFDAPVFLVKKDGSDFIYNVTAQAVVEPKDFSAARDAFRLIVPASATAFRAALPDTATIEKIPVDAADHQMNMHVTLSRWHALSPKTAPQSVVLAGRYWGPSEYLLPPSELPPGATFNATGDGQYFASAEIRVPIHVIEHKSLSQDVTAIHWDTGIAPLSPISRQPNLEVGFNFCASCHVQAISGGGIPSAGDGYFQKVSYGSDTESDIVLDYPWRRRLVWGARGWLGLVAAACLSMLFQGATLESKKGKP